MAFGITVPASRTVKKLRHRNGSPNGQKPLEQISTPTCQMESQPAAGHAEA